MAKIKVTKPQKKQAEVEPEEKKSKKRSDKWIGPPTYKYRYTASLQDTKDPNLYREFAQSNTLADIKKRAEKEVADCLAEDLDLGVLVLDREGWFVTYRYNLVEPPIVERDRHGHNKVVNDIETRIKSWVKDK